jgi:hypothetical protein
MSRCYKCKDRNGDVYTVSLSSDEIFAFVRRIHGLDVFYGVNEGKMTFIWELDICTYVEKSKGDFYQPHPIVEREINKPASHVISPLDFKFIQTILKSAKVSHSFWSNCGKGTPELSSHEDTLAARAFQHDAAKKKSVLSKITLEKTHAGGTTGYMWRFPDSKLVHPQEATPETCIKCREELVDILRCGHGKLGKRCYICYPGNMCIMGII